MKQTAVEFLESQYKFHGELYETAIEQAKEMEKEQQGYSEEDMKDYAEYYNAVANPKTPKDYFKK